jgi:hypothetical protein
MADSDAQTQDLLELELDRRPYFRQLVAQILCMSDGSRELSGWKEFGVNRLRRTVNRNDGRQTF